MKNTLIIALLLFTISGSAGFAQTTAKPDDTMTQLLDYSRPAAEHQLLAQLAGKWKFQDAKLSFVKGTLTRKPIYDGRFFTVDITGGKLQLPVAGGKMKEDNYQGMQLEGYDNGRRQFIMTSVNNHIGSDIQFQTGSYDPSKKEFTYDGTSELIPGEKIKTRRIVKVIDQNNYAEYFYEEKNGEYVKVRELDYSRIN